MIRPVAGGVAAFVVACIAIGSAQQKAAVDDAALRTPEARNQDWLSYGRDYSEQRFSPLDQINDTTVARLGLAWQFETATQRGLEATPLVVDGVMYATGSWSVTYAIDARTGKQLWKYDPEVHRKYDNIACCDVVNRGAAFYKGRVYVGVLDGRLAAIDAASGKVAWQTTTVDQNQPYTITGAPRIAKGKIIIGNGGAEYGVRGYVSAYDAETGKLAWRFYTVPGDPSKPQENKALERALPTWKGSDWWKYGGGGTVWDSIVYDPELNLLYVGTGNGSTWNRHVRSPGGGDNLYLASILAINPDNGELVWHYQTTPGDTWDFTAVQPMMLADLNIGGRPRKVIMQAPKNGFFYVLDRATGELLSADKFVEVNWASHVDMKTGRPVENPGADYKDKGTYVRPGPLGGHNWQAMSFSPKTGLVYLPAQDNGRYFEQGKFNPADFKAMQGDPVQGPLPYNLALGAIDRNMEKYEIPYKGRLLAWDPIARKPRWTAEYGSYWNGGTLATAGNLVFQGTSAGDFIAYNATTGEKLWSSWATTGIMAPPITYSIDGQQYVSVMAGWGGAFAKKHVSYGRLLTFAIGGTATLPSKPRPRTVTVIASTATPAQIAAGAKLYGTYCARCHGGATILPDLRRSTPAVINGLEQILDGALVERGMPRFAEFDKAMTAQLRAYLLDERRKLAAQ
ncbi:MAG TPA: PQQ-dependent dehydrogenase, methanol/ethanol family [Vicinamibacterales bacterium]|nr:PQQ-dependent dehydrogenase, methanol/ethanol family [Vicinamibacterales bacterium]